MTTTFPTCVLHVTDQQLVEWQAHALADVEMRRLNGHIPGCPGCQARLAGTARAVQALQQQRVPDLQQRIWRDLRPRLATSGRPFRPQWRGPVVSGVAAMVLVAVFAAIVLNQARMHPTGTATTGKPTQTAAATATTPVATTTPRLRTPTATPLSVPTAITLAQAWGTAGQRVVTLEGQEEEVEGVTADGKHLLVVQHFGTTNVLPLNPPPEVDLIDTTTGAKETLYSTTTNNVLFAGTDGRYVVWAGGFNLTGGPGESDVNVGYEDLQTGQKHPLISHGDNTVTASELIVTHGKLIIPFNGPSAGLYVADLASGKSETLLPAHAGFVVSWPYVLYYSTFYSDGTSKPSPSDLEPATLLNLETGAHSDVTQLMQLSYYDFDRLALDGATVFNTLYAGDVNGVLFQQIDHADQPGASPRTLFMLNGARDSAYVVGCDSRVLVLQSTVGQLWDRQLHQLIAVPTPPTNTYWTSPQVSNGYVIYAQQAGSQVQVVLVNEAQLPT